MKVNWSQIGSIGWSLERKLFPCKSLSGNNVARQPASESERKTWLLSPQELTSRFDLVIKFR